MFKAGSKTTPKFLSDFEGVILISPSCRVIKMLMKKKLFWGVNRWEKYALVADSSDYDMVRSLQA